MSGLVDTDQETISFVQKSQTGAKYALPQGCLNSVTSVPSFSHGAPARKSRAIRLSNLSPTGPR